MKVLIVRLWEEPALAGAVLLAAVYALAELLIGDGLTASDLPTILAPLGFGLGLRELVTPAERPVKPPEEFAR